MSFLPHWHNEVELMYVREGSAKISVEGVEYNVQKGDLLVCGSHSIHFSDSYNMPNCLEFILFNPNLILSNGSAWHKNLHLSSAEMQKLGIQEIVLDLFKAVTSELDKRKPHYQNIVTSFISAIWYTLLRHFPPIDENLNHVGIKKFEKAIVFIHTQFREPISLEDVAARVNLAPTYFSSLFHQFVGISFVRYLQIIRIDEAIRLLQRPDYRIIDAALDSGFSNVRNFNRVFQKITGKTPSAFLKENQNKPLSFSLPYKTGDDSHVENKSFVVLENSEPLVEASDSTT